MKPPNQGTSIPWAIGRLHYITEEEQKMEVPVHDKGGMWEKKAKVQFHDLTVYICCQPVHSLKNQNFVHEKSFYVS